MNNHDEKQVGSNLTGAAIPGKPGHERDVRTEPDLIDQTEGKTQNPKGHIENTDALLGSVDPEDN